MITKLSCWVTGHSPPFSNRQNITQRALSHAYATATTGNNGTVSPLLRLAITSAKNGLGSTFRLRHASITQASKATTRLPSWAVLMAIDSFQRTRNLSNMGLGIGTRRSLLPFPIRRSVPFEPFICWTVRVWASLIRNPQVYIRAKQVP